MARKTEIQVGLTVLVALALLLWGVTWLKEFSLARRVKIWHVAFTQAGGLGKSDEVLVNGLRKGEVREIELSGDHVVVDIALASEIGLTDQSRVAIRNVGLMGEKQIAVDFKPGGLGLYHIHGGGMVVGDRFTGIGTVLDWVDTMDSVVVSVEYRLAPEHPDPAPLDDCYAGICNSVRISNTILNASHITELTAGTEDYANEIAKNRRLEDIAADLGFELSFFNLSEYHKSGALLSCMLLHLNRHSYTFALT